MKIVSFSSILNLTLASLLLEVLLVWSSGSKLINRFLRNQFPVFFNTSFGFISSITSASKQITLELVRDYSGRFTDCILPDANWLKRANLCVTGSDFFRVGDLQLNQSTFSDA